MNELHKDEGSFRDPSGFVYTSEGILYRQVNHSYKENYERLMNSGLYDELLEKNLIVPHQVVEADPFDESSSYLVIQPVELPFISYPYEWCFSQHKRAALATLEIQKRALAYGMTLKDSSAYNIQFSENNPVLIDTLSFEIYTDGSPWEGYQQFCKHFFAPLLLMSYRDVRLNSLLRVFIDGIPLDVASSLLPSKTRLNFSILAHIHLHAKAQERYLSRTGTGESSGINKPENTSMKKEGLLSILDSLERQIDKLDRNQKYTSWGDYRSFHNYSDASYQHKLALVDTYIQQAAPRTVWDFGANTGDFSRLASSRGINTISFDIDPGAIEQGYLQSVAEQDSNIQHYIIDLFNPSPNLGWDNKERKALKARGPADLLLALALIHHLAIGNNLPFEMISTYFSELAEWLIIEFVPKTDSQVELLLSSRKDIFSGYTIENFEVSFSKDYSIIDKRQIEGTERTLYLMRKKG